MPSSSTLAVRLKRLLASAEEHLPKALDYVWYQRKRAALGRVISGIADHARTRGTCAYYLEGDAAAFRQWFYVASRLVIANFAHAGIWEGGGNGVLGMGECLLYALLS